MFNSIFSFFSSNYLEQKGQSFSCLLRLFHLLHFLQKKPPEVFCKEVFSDFATFTESTCAKETLAQVFCCEFCQIFKNTFFHKTPPVAASGASKIVHNFWNFSSPIISFFKSKDYVNSYR